MSKIKNKVRHTLAAKQDIKEIWFYSVASWGEKRTERYISQLENQFEKLADSPELGHDRSEINKAYRSIPSGKHVIFYMINGDCIDVIGIPHSNMDILQYFED